VRFSQPFDFVEIDLPILTADTVGKCVEPFARKVRPRAVRQVPARGKRHPEDGIARRQQRQEHGLVCLRPGMRLDIGERAFKKPLGTIDRQRFNVVDKLAPAVIAAPGIALGVFVGQNRTLSLQHRPRDDVLAGDQFDLPLLAILLAIDRRRQFGIGLEQGGGIEAASGRP